MNGQPQVPYPMYSPPYLDPWPIIKQWQEYNLPQPPQEPPKKTEFVYRPVGGIEEAKAAQIDWDGTVYFFEDKAAGRIYRKQYAEDAVSFAAYSLVELPEPQMPQYVTAETMAELTGVIAALNAKFEDLEKRLPPAEVKQVVKGAKANE